MSVSPAAISKAVGLLEAMGIIHRRRDPRSRAEPYVIGDDVWFQAIMASTRIDTRIAAASARSARALGPATPAGARLVNLSQFLHHVTEDLVRSAEHWRQVYFPSPPPAGELRAPADQVKRAVRWSPASQTVAVLSSRVARPRHWSDLLKQRSTVAALVTAADRRAVASPARLALLALVVLPSSSARSAVIPRPATDTPP
ncbi:hypothetical protein SGLAM104S_07560 [Streptomyces glaucescens]